jgi:hypothetical protein
VGAKSKLSVGSRSVQTKTVSLCQEKGSGFDPLLFSVLEGLLQRIYIEHRVKDIVETLIIVEGLERCWDDDGSGSCREVHGKACVKGLWDDDAFSFIANGPCESIDHRGDTRQDEQVVSPDRLARPEVGVEKRGKRLSEPGASFWARTVGEMADWINHELDDR